MINLHIVLNTFENDSRILKETQTIDECNFFDKVCVAAVMDNNLDQYEKDEFRNLWRVPLATKKLSKGLLIQLIKYLEWRKKIINRYAKENIGIVHCHDLSALPVGVALKKRNPKIRIVYDAHELETERNGSKGIRKKLAKMLERRLITNIDALITVSPSIQEWYRQKYGNESVLLRNVPQKDSSSSSINKKKYLKNEFNIKERDILFIYQGGLTKGRGIEKLVEVFEKVGQDKHIVFMGNGPLSSLVQSSKSTNIHHENAVSNEKVIAYVSSADIGIYLMEDTCLNHRYSLPNKLFEHLQAGIPTIVNNFPDQRKIVEEYNAGWVMDDSQNMVEFINSITIEMIKSKSYGVKKAQEELCWENEKKKLEELYKGVK